jgi:hypothetical protein
MWALLPWANAGADLLLDTGDRSAVWEQSRALVILNYAAFSVAIVITLWGTERIARRLEGLRATTSHALAGDPSERFREINSVVGRSWLRVRRRLRSPRASSSTTAGSPRSSEA